MSTHAPPGLLLAPLLAAFAIWVAGARVGRVRVRDLMRDGPGATAWPQAARRVTVWLHMPVTRVLGATGACAVVLAVVERSLVPLGVAVPVAVFLGRRRAQADARRTVGRVCAGVAELASVMVGELRAGQPPCEAFVVAVECLDGPIRTCLADSLSVARGGGDMPAALSRAAAGPGADGLARIAACWCVAADHGAGFAPALDRIAAGLRAEEAGSREVEAELSGARATARLLAALPLFGILLGHGIGADPLSLLFHAPLGIACLVLGLVLLGTGLSWTDRIARGGVT